MNTPKPPAKKKGAHTKKSESFKKYNNQKERAWNQLLFAVQSFSMFIHACEQSQALSSSYATEVKEKVKKLLEGIQKKGLPQEESFNHLNEIIEKTNKTLAPFPEQAEYPLFFGNNVGIQVKNQILAFQNYLHQEVKCKHLEFKVQAPFFEDAFTLWLGISRNSLTPRKCMLELGQLIQKVNKKLNQEDRYPLPDINAYDDETFSWNP